MTQVRRLLETDAGGTVGAERGSSAWPPRRARPHRGSSGVDSLRDTERMKAR